MGQIKIREHEYIDEELLERFAIGVYPAMVKFYQSEEGQRAYREWLATKEEREREERKRKQRRNRPER